MDEDQVVKAGMEVVLRPVTDIAENALGLLGGDWLSEKRARNWSRLKEKTEKILKEQGVTLDDDPSPSVMMPLLTAAQEEGREEILDLWAALLAAATDPSRQARYRREFVEIVKQLEPLDAIVLKALSKKDGGVWYEEREDFAEMLSVSEDQLEVSLQALRSLGLISDRGLKQGVQEASSLARELSRALEGQ